MPHKTKVWPLGFLLILLLLFLNFWMWDNDALILGLPVNLLYHIGMCFLATLAMWVIVRKAWPHHLDEEDTE
ncbi:MAG: DUF3311 domain-containing protein [Candidatus Latescibacteria bacterium]|jgi:hypothetical protein|nr:DUF3311 domain-containing protein [Candidatus Latescibacterota bacterium]